MPALIWAPFPDEAAAIRAIEALLEQELVGCGNIVKGLRSVFRWQGRMQSAEEAGVLFKTNAHLLDRAVASLTRLHPYEEPAIVGWVCDAAAPATVNWLAGLSG